MDIREKEWFIKAPWGRIALMAWGDAALPPVLICHGKQDAASSFRPLVNNLPRQFYYIAVDLPGNGKSDSFPPGLPISTFDFIQTLKVIIDHFDWRKFIYIGHSLGSLIGKYYNFAYPGRMVKMVDLDPVPGYYTIEPEDFSKWNWKFYGRFFDPENYHKLNAGRETAPRYTYEQCFEMLKKNRDLTDEATKHAIERIIEKTDDGRYRFTFDQRMKMVVRPPISAKLQEELYSKIEIPVHTVLAKGSIDRGSYSKVPFILDVKKPRKGPYSVVIVEGKHDVHITHPELVAPSVAQFLLTDFNAESSKAKL